ncbi:hypothetical protein A6R68_17305, partial [Neotoma lepida]
AGAERVARWGHAFHEGSAEGSEPLRQPPPAGKLRSPELWPALRLGRPMWGFGSAAVGRPGAVHPGGRLGRSVFKMMPVQVMHQTAACCLDLVTCPSTPLLRDSNESPSTSHWTADVRPTAPGLHEQDARHGPRVQQWWPLGLRSLPKVCEQQHCAPDSGILKEVCHS